jgi:serine/threonine protein kinase
MGIVWKVWDRNRNEHVAIKSIANDLIADSNFKNRFLDEVSRHTRLDHPNIVPVLDVFEADGESCMVMELIEGESLANLLASKAQTRMKVHEAIPIVQDILRALDFAHRRGIIHRDVKPSNVIVDKRKQAHLIDFGIAIAVGEERRTRTGQVLGTSFYMSPEQIVKPRSIDHRTDVYSVACVFYEMITGRPPFLPQANSEGDTDFLVKQAHVNEAPVHPKDRVASIPDEVDRIIMRALEKDPNQRLPGCQEFSKRLDQIGATPVKESMHPHGNKLGKGAKHALFLVLIIFLGLFLFMLLMTK